jgi:hypothetical protein
MTIVMEEKGGGLQAEEHHPIGLLNSILIDMLVWLLSLGFSTCSFI